MTDPSHDDVTPPLPPADTSVAPVRAHDPAGLEALIRRAGSHKGPPPVERWHPPFCGDLDIRIKADGSWHYLGTPIGREPLVRLFASVLRKDEDGRTYLVTPVEKIGIIVEDAPFIGVELHADGSGRDLDLTLRTNVGDIVEIGPDHRLRFTIDPDNGGLRPYVHVRGRLEARLSRPATYDLISHGAEVAIDGETWFAVHSRGAVFPMLRATELPSP